MELLAGTEMLVLQDYLEGLAVVAKLASEEKREKSVLLDHLEVLAYLD